VIWTGRQGRVGESVTAASCKIFSLLCAEDTVLFASFQLGLHHAMDGLSATCGLGCQVDLFKPNFRNLTLSQVG